MRRISHRQFNNILTVVVVLLALYISASPFIPSMSLWIKKRFDKTQGYAYQSKLVSNPSTPAPPIPADNRIVIPSILLNEPIFESNSIRVIDNGGTWRRPNTSTPDNDGNTVIIGHRYTYKGLSTFYNLDKVKQNDPIIVYWKGKEYDYKVTQTQTVAPSATEIEKNTDAPILTIYTCTPLWSAKNRLVLVAEPIGERNE